MNDKSAPNEDEIFLFRHFVSGSNHLINLIGAVPASKTRPDEDKEKVMAIVRKGLKDISCPDAVSEWIIETAQLFTVEELKKLFGYK